MSSRLYVSASLRLNVFAPFRLYVPPSSCLYASTPSHRFVSYRILSLSPSYRIRIVSYRVVSYRYRYRIVSVLFPHRLTKHCVALHRIVPYRIVSYPHRIVSSHEALYRIVSYRIVIAIVSYCIAPCRYRLSYSIRIVSVSYRVRVLTSPRLHVSTSP